jgi:hypothetical protein
MGGLIILHVITIIRQDEHEKFRSSFNRRKLAGGDGANGPFVLVDVKCRSARAFPSIPFFWSHLNCLSVLIRTIKS